MTFSSLEFLTVFLPVTVILYFILPTKLRNGLLLLCSLVFYAWGEPVYILLMIFFIVMNYVFGLCVDSADKKGNTRAKKLSLALSVVMNIGLLSVFKYADFAVGTVNGIFKAELTLPGLALPIGISFFTFQAMSYVIDVYRKNAEVQKNILNFGLYISLFPQLIAGPIVRYSTVADAINNRTVSFDLAAKGIKRFITGLAKKVLLANNIGYLWTILTENGSDISALSAWLAIIAYAFQIYFDFSGYSDMAIGLGLIFGFEFDENFDHPYISKSITEFWRRWHISLGTWFKEYVYIPLGGNRKGKLCQMRNIAIVWILTGLWHGAAWNFVLWGVYYGVLLVVEKFFLKKALDKLPSFVSRIYTILAVLFGWALFAFDDMTLLGGFIRSLFGGNGLTDSGFMFNLTSNAVLLVILAVASTPVVTNLINRFREKKGESNIFFILELLWFTAVFILCVAYLVDSTYNPFIYFRF